MTPAIADPYAALAEIYDDWQERYGAFWRLVLPRLRAAIEEHGLPTGMPPSFVDLGCGTGGLLLALRAAHPGWRLAGVDASAGMLAAARRKPLASTVEWVHGSFEAPLPAGSFAAAGAFFDALNHAAAPGELARALAAAGRALAPGGMFVFDVNNEEGYRAWWQGRRVYPGAGWTLVMEAEYDEAAQLARGRAIVEARRPDGRRGVSEVIERCFSEAEIRAALAAAGLEPLRAEPWRPLADDVPGKTWWVARRR